MRIRTLLASGFYLAATAIGHSDEPTNQPRPIPLTRPEMKQLIEAMKKRTPRIPLPDLTAADKEALGDRANNYEGRLRYHYMTDVESGFGMGARPAGGGGGGRQGRTEGAAPGTPMQNADQSLTNTFKVQLFWIVSRANNCQYCQGHQEGKLLRAGQTEDQIAALDVDWSGFTEAERTAFAFARKYTLSPHELNDADIAGLKKHYTEPQILEMILSMAGNNAINRWKEGVGVPQSEGGGGFGAARDAQPAPEKHTYLTPTSPKYSDLVTKVAAITIDEKTGKPTTATVCRRPALESASDLEAMMKAAETRKPRLTLATVEVARTMLPEGVKDHSTPNWVRLLATMPVTGKAKIANQLKTESQGQLSALEKAKVSWVVARQDRAWYALGDAKKRLIANGMPADQILHLDGDGKALSERDRVMLNVARKLAASPVVLTDDDVSMAVKVAGPRDVVQLVNYVTSRVSFNRITESAGLPIDQ